MAELFTVKEVAGLLRCSLPTVKRLLKRGEFPIVRVGKRVLVRKEAVEAWIQAHEIPANGDRAVGTPAISPAPDRLAQAVAVAQAAQVTLPLEDQADAEGNT